MNDLRESLDAAVETVEEETPEETNEVESTAAPEAAQETSTEGETEAPEQGAQAEEPPEQPPEPPEPAESPQAAVAPTAPPIGWSEELKASWNELPEGVRQAIGQREAEVETTLQRTAGERRIGQDLQKIVQPFQQMMQAEGVQNPLQGIQGLLQTTAELHSGNAQQKAAKIAQLISHYQVDIETLDGMLVEQTQTAADPQTQRLNQLLEQRLAPVNQLLAEAEQAKQRSQQQAIARGHQTVEQFAADPAHPHFQQVREVMADFMALSRQQGTPMDMEQAYQRACAMDPTISQQVATQRTQAQVRDANGRFVKKQNAASSVSGQRSGDGGPSNKDLSMRDLLEKGFEDTDRI